MPFNFWCGGCGRHIAKGVRFNAEKKQIHSYLDIPIFSFRMKCPSCSNGIELQNDPQKADYTVVSGGRRKVEGVEDPEDIGIAKPKTKEEAEKLINNPFFKLEHEFTNLQRAQDAQPKLKQLQAKNELIYAQDFDSSGRARKSLRAEKEALKEEEKKIKKFKERLAISDLPLLPEDDRDIQKASEVKFTKKEDINAKMDALKNGGIFERGKSSKYSRKSSGSVLDQLSLGKK